MRKRSLLYLLAAPAVWLALSVLHAPAASADVFPLDSGSSVGSSGPSQPAQPVLPGQVRQATPARLAGAPRPATTARLATPARPPRIRETSGLQAPTKLPTGGPVVSVHSTAYCLTSGTATGHPVGDGVVASNLGDGTTWRILDGPQAGKVVTVWDHPDDKTQFDIWMASCTSARQYGDPDIHVERVG